MGNSLGIRIERDRNEDINSQQVTDKWIFYLLVTAIILTPILIGGNIKEVISPLISEEILLSSGIKVDIYTVFKNGLLLVLTTGIMALFLYKLFFLNYSIPKRSYVLSISFFLIAVLISTIFSPTKTIALYGLYNRTDGAMSYICYILLMFFAIHINYPKNAVKYVLYAFYPFIIINFVITTMNFTGYDVLEYKPVQNIITMFFPEGVTLNEGSILVGTLNHWNYMSGMFAVITVMYLAWIIVDTNYTRKFINFITVLLSITSMLIAMSASGFVTLISIAPFLIWLAFKSINKKSSFILLTLFIVLTSSIIHILSLKNPEVWEESIGFFLPINPYVEDQSTNTTNSSGWNPSIILSNTAFAADKTFDLPALPESGWGPGTGRIYIWKESLKLLNERPLFGYGLDTIMYNFPHNNIDARANLTMVTIVDKPHSFYIGVLYGTGIIGFLLFLWILIPTVWISLKVLFKFNKTSNITVTLTIAWLAFLFQALFNDSLPGTTGPMFVVGGIMMGLLYKKNEKEETI